MKRVEQALRSLMDRDLPLVEVLAPDGSTARTISYRDGARAAAALQRRLRALRPSGALTDRPLRVGIVCGNSPDFVIADLACLASRATEVPVPLAFSRTQAASLLGTVDVCLHDAEGAGRLASWGPGVLPAGCAVIAVELDALLAERGGPLEIPSDDGDWICKTIHTSGTTSQPKGVRIRAHGLDALMGSLHEEMPPGTFRRYLSTVPLSLLIEQVTGLYMVILHEGVLILLPPDAPLVGTSVAAAAQVLPFLRASRSTALVATPALVDEICQVARAKTEGRNLALFGSEAVPLLCCGGAPVDVETLNALDRMGIPVYEGYGLSENGSVVSWNRPSARRIGSVGTPLPHVQVRIGDDDELLVKSTSLFAGYTVDDPSSCVIDEEGWLHTGDLARIDEDGFLYITGRKKNVIITSAGRNIAPEWVEAQYATLPFVRAVAVIGNRLPALHGLFLIDPAHDLVAAADAVATFGRTQLSEVERVQVVHMRHANDSDYRKYFTVTGRPVRDAIYAALISGAFEHSQGKERVDHHSSRVALRDLELHRHGHGPGMVVTDPSGRPLGALDPRTVVGMLAESGYLLFSGFQVDLSVFSQFVVAHSSRVTLDPARVFHGGKVAQKVDAGHEAMGLHLENGNSPFRPDLTWFFCEKAASDGSQTTVCDGSEVWRKASASAKRQFEGQEIMYLRRVEENKWKTFVYHYLAATRPTIKLEEITVADILALVAGDRATIITPQPDGSIIYQFTTPAVHRTLFGDQVAWANSIFGPSYNYEAPKITFGDGREIPAGLLEEMRALTDELTQDIDWRNGEVAMIDNTRVMHGRRAIKDPSRTIFNALSYLSEDLRPARSSSAGTPQERPRS